MRLHILRNTRLKGRVKTNLRVVKHAKEIKNAISRKETQTFSLVTWKVGSQFP